MQACYTAADNEAICLKLIDGGANPDSTFEAKMETALHASAASGSAQVNRHHPNRGTRKVPLPWLHLRR